MKKDNWEIAVEKFLEVWPYKKETIAVAACGSFITGNPSKHSDVDLQIVLSNKVNWRERGNKVIGGFLIEYFANPPKQIKKYFKDEFNERKQHTAHMIYTGRIIFDNGTLKSLKKEAKRFLSKDFSKCPIDKIENYKYHLWDIRDNLEEIYDSKSIDFDFVYFNFLYALLNIYFDFVGYHKIDVHKVNRFLTSEKDIKKYMLKDFADKHFINLFVSGLKEQDDNKKEIIFNSLTEYVLKKMGGFEVDCWKFKSKVKI